jgi:hypothetical protein
VSWLGDCRTPAERWRYTIEHGTLYPPTYISTDAQSLVVMDRSLCGSATIQFQAPAHALTISA